MKKTIFTLATAALILASCGGKENASSSAAEVSTDIEVSDVVTNEAGYDDSDESYTSDDSTNNNWDATLDEYEKFVDKYVAAIKNKNLTSAASLMESAESLGNKLESADNLTPAQASRLLKINNKLAEAAASMAGDASDAAAAAADMLKEYGF